MDIRAFWGNDYPKMFRIRFNYNSRIYRILSDIAFSLFFNTLEKRSEGEVIDFFLQKSAFFYVFSLGFVIFNMKG